MSWKVCKISELWHLLIRHSSCLLLLHMLSYPGTYKPVVRCTRSLQRVSKTIRQTVHASSREHPHTRPESFQRTLRSCKHFVNIRRDLPSAAKSSPQRTGNILTLSRENIFHLQCQGLVLEQCLSYLPRSIIY